MSAGELSERQIELLRRCNEDLTWRDRSNRGPSYRLWIDEYNYDVVTREVRPLIDRGLIRRYWAHASSGGCELTHEGHEALAAAGSCVQEEPQP